MLLVFIELIEFIEFIEFIGFVGFVVFIEFLGFRELIEHKTETLLHVAGSRRPKSATTSRAGGMRQPPRRGRGHAMLVVADL
jgi:hypothetical protein